MDNILSARLYRPGSVAYVSRSGGMSNELNNIIALNTDGVLEGIAIGGDRYTVLFRTFHASYDYEYTVQLYCTLVVQYLACGICCSGVSILRGVETLE